MAVIELYSWPRSIALLRKGQKSPNLEPVGGARTIATGEPYLDPGLTRLLMHSLSNPPAPQAQEIVTPRELDILRKMATPATYREIAAQLSISEETVRSHAKNILRKFEKADRMQAVLEAVRLGIINPL